MKCKIHEWINNPARFFSGLLIRLRFILPDKIYLSCLVRLKCGYWPNWECPLTYNEKLQWLKLYNRKPEYTMMVDKLVVKDFVRKKIGDDYVIPTIGVWDRPEDIEWDLLPDKFVLKTTQGGGNAGVVICKDKNNLNKNNAIIKLRKALKQNIYSTLREWPYKNVPRKIIAEEYIGDGIDDLPDFKFFCFDGVVKALFVGTERGTGNVKFDFYDDNFVHLDIVQSHPMSGKIINKPDGFDEMKEISSKLSVGIPHVRVDLYNIKGKIYFGELTFFHHGGVTPFHPQSWDFIFGSWINLPQKTKGT